MIERIAPALWTVGCTELYRVTDTKHLHTCMPAARDDDERVAAAFGLTMPSVTTAVPWYESPL